YRVNGGDPFSESIQLPYTLYRGGSLYHNFANFEDFSAKGPYVIDAWLQYGPDYLVSNDSVHDFRIVNPLLMHKENILTFEAATGSLDSMYSAPGTKAQGFLSAKAARTGALGFEITGGNIQQDYLDKKAQLPNKDNVWKINESYRSKTCICADLSNLVSADLKFDRKQMYSSYYRGAFGYNMPYASSMQVLVNDESISETYKPITQSVDAWKNHKLSLNDFVGNTVEICFQTYTGLNPTYDSTGVGDRVLLDNITITGQAVTGTSQILTQAPTWTVMPNPGSGAFLLSYQAPEAQALRIDVLDALGRTVATQNRTVSAGGNVFPLQLEGKAAGIYLIRLRAEGQQTSSQKLILR
ncbi:MAG: T9SS type A sorting domain-containing protein, partial [Saprospiraceae bacterium]|nr:T9SS type A sorting domain-containing protein [Saprospiraceae bacterium]